MQKFLEQKIVRMLLVVLMLIATVAVYYYNIQLYQKIPNNSKKEPATENQTLKNQKTDIAEDEFICPEDYAGDETEARVEGLVRQLGEIKKENPGISDEEVIRKRYQQLVDHNCYGTLFKTSVSEFPEIITFEGKKYGPKATDVDKETKVKSIYYPLEGQESGEAEEEIFFNFYDQGFWAQNPFTIEDVAREIMDRLESNGYTMKYQLGEEDEDGELMKYSLIETAVFPEKKYGSIFFEIYEKIDNGNIFSLNFIKNIDGEGDLLQKKTTDWNNKNSKRLLESLSNLELSAEEESFESEE